MLDAFQRRIINIIAGLREIASNSGPGNEEAIMVMCPECESNLDVEEDELDEGEIISCSECGNDFEVVGVEPLELTKVGEEDELDEEDSELDDEGDY